MKTSDYNLIEKYLDGTTTPEEFAVMEGRLRTDPAMRLELLQEAGFEGQLRILLKTAPVVYPQIETSEPTETIGVEEPSLPQPRKIIFWRPAWLWIPVAAAAAALVVAVVLPLLPARHAAEIARTGVSAPKNASSATNSATQPLEGEHVVATIATHSTGSTAATAPNVEPAGMTVSPHGNVPEKPVVAATLERVTPPVEEAPAPRLENQMGKAVGAVAYQATVAVPGQFLENHAPAPAPALTAVAAILPRANGQITSANGSVFLARVAGASKVRRAAQPGDNFLPGDTVETGPLSGGALRYTDGSTVRIYSDTQVTLNQTGNDRKLALASGALDLRVQPLAAGSILTVTTPHIEARVVGTEFRVLADDQGSWVGVKTGRVEVVRFRANNEVVQVDPGYFAASTRGWPPARMADPNWRGKCQTFTGSPKYQ